MGHAAGYMDPIAALYGIFDSLNREYALSVINNYPVGPGVCMRLLLTGARLKVKASHNIVAPKMERSKDHLFRSVFYKIPRCFGKFLYLSYIFAHYVNLPPFLFLNIDLGLREFNAVFNRILNRASYLDKINKLLYHSGVSV